jgi:hypothetical protein
MSLDDLITLLLVVLFVGLPLAQRLLGRVTGSQRPGETPDRPRRQGPEGAGERTADSSTGSGTAEAQQTRGAGGDFGGRSTQAPEGASELERRIADARRRVQEAREGPSAQTGRARGAAPGSGSQSTPRPLVSSRPPTQSFLGREGGSVDTPQVGGFLGREGVRDEPRKRTAPLQVAKRTRKPRGSTLSQARGVVSLRRDDIFNGIVWHQILSDPVSARYMKRRKPLRDR